MSRFWRIPAGGLLALAVALCPEPGAAAGVRITNGGAVDASPARRLGAKSVLAPRELVRLDQRITIEGEPYFYSGPLSFDWTSDTVSVLVYQEPRPADGAIYTAFDSRRPEVAYSGEGPSASFVVPGADVPVATGRYQFEIAATVDQAEVIMVRRRGPQPTSGTLDVNLFVIEGAGIELPQLEEAARLFVQTMAAARITVGRVTLYTVTGASDLLSVPSDTGIGSALRQVPTISSLADEPAAANIFFVREIASDDGGLYGISMGIPAALTIPGTISSGVIVNVSAHQTEAGFDTRELGQTITHETGHSLGLYHTSERDGSSYDTITDTPQCVGADPLDAAACPDGANFMFWSGRDFQVSGGQAYVLVRSPVVR
jgi:hypothetical protein